MACLGLSNTNILHFSAIVSSHLFGSFLKFSPGKCKPLPRGCFFPDRTFYICPQNMLYDEESWLLTASTRKATSGHHRLQGLMKHQSGAELGLRVQVF